MRLKKLLCFVPVVAANITEVHLRMTVSVQERRHFVDDKKEYDAFLEGCFDNRRNISFSMVINAGRDDATGMVKIDAGTHMETCALNLKISKRFERRHPAIITMCNGGSCNGTGTCNSPCVGGTCEEIAGHELGLCNDDQSQSGLCTLDTCRDCSNGIVHINCEWEEYDVVCKTSCDASIVEGADVFTLLYYILFPCLCILFVAVAVFLIQYTRIQNFGDWRYTYSSFMSSVSRKKNLGDRKLPTPMQSRASPSTQPLQPIPINLISTGRKASRQLKMPNQENQVQGSSDSKPTALSAALPVLNDTVRENSQLSSSSQQVQLLRPGGDSLIPRVSRASDHKEDSLVPNSPPNTSTPRRNASNSPRNTRDYNLSASNSQRSSTRGNGLETARKLVSREMASRKGGNALSPTASTRYSKNVSTAPRQNSLSPVPRDQSQSYRDSHGAIISSLPSDRRHRAQKRSDRNSLSGIAPDNSIKPHANESKPAKSEHVCE